MAETTETTPSPPLPSGAPTAHLGLARAALFWERVWPSLALSLGIIGVYVAAALFDLPEMVPGWVHGAALALALGLLATALWQALRGFRLPDQASARRRLETASGLAHRPLTVLADKLAGSSGDPVAAALWQAHRERMARQVRRLRIGLPVAGFVSRDPYGLRVVLAIVLLLGAIDAGGDAGDRLLRSLAPRLSFTPGPAAAVSLDIWVTPPDYTGLPPRFLQRDATTEPVAIPTGSTVLAQVQGGRDVPRIEVDGKATDFARIDAKNFKGSTTLTAGHQLAVTQDGRKLGAWPITVIPDQPPTIAFVGIPQKTLRDAFRIEYQASDDYGVESAKAVIHRVGAPADETIELELPLPGLHLKEAHNASFHDLTAHLWAGLPVEIHLEATDAPGQIGKSETLTVTLPERQFHHPIARALVEQRRELMLHPDQREIVAETISDLSIRPALYRDDTVAFLAMRIARVRLLRDRSAEAIPAVQQLLWDTALRIEDGHASVAQRDLRDIMQALQDAIARNAPDAEIERLTRELKDAIDRYLRALAENAQRQNPDGKNLPPIDPSRLMTDRDLQRMLDRARDLARTGAKDAARDLLSQLQNMLENLRLAQPQQMQSGAGQAMRDMQDMMRRQQQLLDRSFRQSRQAPGSSTRGQRQQGQQGDNAGDAAEQEALRRMLGEMMGRLGEQGDVPQALGRAERAMRGATDALQRGQPGDAVGPQSEALDQLQQAARELMDQMNSAFGGPGGNTDLPDGAFPQADRDPFGRPQSDSAEGTYSDGRLRMGQSKVDSFGIERAKQILDELRRRAGETARPDLERDYIDRLLRRF